MKLLIKILCISLILIFPQAPEASMLKLEQNFDRPGGDIKNIPNVGSAGQCMNMCRGDQRCKAFTWVRPGLQRSGGRCYLKSIVPAGYPNGCCVSGIVPRAALKPYCKWHQFGSTYECKCKVGTADWYLVNPSSCPMTKPNPRYIEPRVTGDNFGVGTGVFGQ